MAFFSNSSGPSDIETRWVCVLGVYAIIDND